MRIVASVAGVLCTRVRLEEKRLISALGSLGVDVKPFPPTDAPLPIQPLSANAAGGEMNGEMNGETIRVVIDRLQERATAAVWLPYWRQPGRELIDGGVASSLDRLSIARLLAEAGLPRPETALVISESSGLNAIELFEGTGTLLPLQTGSRELPLLDKESAEAVLEHRGVLGEAPDAISLMQQGVAATGMRVVVTTVNGVAIATDGTLNDRWAMSRISILATDTARLLGARLLSVTIAEIDGRLVVWDIDPIPGFRNAVPLGDVSVEAAIANLTAKLMGMSAASATFSHAPLHVREESGEHVIFSA